MAFRQTRTLLITAALGALMAGGPALSQADNVGAGAYLAARQASMLSDYKQAARYYREAVAQSPNNLTMLENAMVAAVGVGNIDAAVELAMQYEVSGGENQISDLILNAEAMVKSDFVRPANVVIEGKGITPLLDGIQRAWALLGQGQMSDATTAFEEVAAIDDLSNFARYHQALAFAMVGDFEAADEILSGERHGPLVLSPRGVGAHAQILVQLERRDDAIELLSKASRGGYDAELYALREQIIASDTIPYDFVTTARQGVAELYFNIAAVLNGRAAPEHMMIYSRLVQHLRPDHMPAVLTVAGTLETLDQYELAVQAYGQVSADHPSYFLAEMGRADALYAADRKDAAVEVLMALGKSHGDIARVQASLGDMLSRMKRDDEAIVAYTNSIELRADDDRAAWPVYYARGIVHERQDHMAEMEADFRKALELSPNQPDVLNYLGYSLVEQRTKLDEALGMIETAVAERPQSGYITDSLGWVLYRLGRYQEAVEPMERAVSLLPIDPIVNDHLGDVYWKVGRFREAEFQWKRALSFQPEEAEAERIRKKLAVGLDKVLEEEAKTGATLTSND